MCNLIFNLKLLNFFLLRYSYVRVETGYPQYINEGWLKCYPPKNQDEVFIKALYSENDIGEEP